MYPATLLQLLADSVDAAPLHYETQTMLSGALDMQACTELRPVGCYIRGWYDLARRLDIDIAIEVVGNGLRLVVTEHSVDVRRTGRLVWAGPVVRAAQIVAMIPAVERVGVEQ